MELEQITAVFGWMTLINLIIYTLAAFVVIFARDWAVSLQARLTGLPESDWPAIHVDYLVRYKLMILILNLVPYLALRIVG